MSNDSIMRRRTAHALAAWFVLVWMWPSAAQAAESVGKIVAMEGTVELSRTGGPWQAAGVGGDVSVGDRIKTGRPGRARLAFRDDSTINVGDDSVFRIDEQVMRPEQSAFRSVMQLLRGKVRAVVGEGYDSPRSSYEIQTATAVSGVRGTEFVVTYDPIAETTDVVTISGRVEVRSTADLAATGVFVTAGELTSVPRGARASAPRQLDDAEMRRYLLDVEFIGGGRLESMLRGGKALEHAPAAGEPATTEPSGLPQNVDESTNPRETPGDVLDQPSPVLEDLGGAIVNF